MKICAMGSLLLLLGAGCATNKDRDMVETQVLTYPDGALIEFNGQPAGRAPARVVLPQNEEGRLTDRAVVRALPNSNQETIYAQTRVFDPSDRDDPVPNRILIDMRVPGPDAPLQQVQSEPGELAPDEGTAPRSRIPYTERSKPTQAVGIDRWNPGKY